MNIQEDDEDLETEAPVSSTEFYLCAFCGEENEVVVDASGARVQRYTEDCFVCCRPNLLSITIHRDDSVEVSAEQEYEA